ncbi:transposase family protein [Candidatus Poribacteria bacterium]|nr:transposase family protein [Candidatus Poribacteria bacterium]
MHQANPKLGCWRLSLFEYENQKLGATTIWRLLNEAKRPKSPPEPISPLSHPHQMWFSDHRHLKTLENGQKVYSLIIVDGWSRVLLSESVITSKGARDACVILLATFARWGLPGAILSDNAKAFTSFLYTLLLGVLRVGVCYTAPGHLRENPFAEALIGTLRAYFYPHVQRQKRFAGGKRIYREKTHSYNHRVHWEFRHDEIKTPVEKMALELGRPLPEKFSLRVLATGKRVVRTVDGHGRSHWQRSRLDVRVELAKSQVEIREFFDSLVVTYRSGSVVSYAPQTHQKSQVTAIQNTPVFHQHHGIDDSPQLELFDLSSYPLRYVTRRPVYRRRRSQRDASQLTSREILHPK